MEFRKAPNITEGTNNIIVQARHHPHGSTEGGWSQICMEHWSHAEAMVACRQLHSKCVLCLDTLVVLITVIQCVTLVSFGWFHRRTSLRLYMRWEEQRGSAYTPHFLLLLILFSGFNFFKCRKYQSTTII